QGKLAEAATTIRRFEKSEYGADHRLGLLVMQGDLATLRSIRDSALRAGPEARNRVGLPTELWLALFEGRWRAGAGGLDGELAELLTAAGAARVPEPPVNGLRSLYEVMLQAFVKGPSPALAARADSAIARIPFRDLPPNARPYLDAARPLALAGSPDKA